MATCMVGGRGALSVCVDFSVVVKRLWRLSGNVHGLERGVLSVCVDVSLVVMTICDTICVEACMVWRHGALSACVDFSLVSTTGGCTESIIVVVSIVTTMG